MFACAASSPLVYTYGSPFVASPYSAALVAPEVVAPGVAPVVTAAYPYSSVSAYSYGSSYSIQDYLLNTAAGAPVAAYSLPYAYAADWYYRK